MSISSSGRTLAILGFHNIGEPSPGGWRTWFYIPEATFVSYLTWFREGSWQVLDLGTLLQGLAAPAGLPERAIVLTFDDGCRSLVDVALPWLRRFGYPAVFFVPTDFIGGRNTWGTAAGTAPDEVICDWDDLHELERWGVAVQSHGASHRHLSTLDPAEQEDELCRSKAVLETGLGRPVECFAYPYGDGGDPPLVAGLLRRTGYRAACLYNGDPVTLPDVDLYRLPRVAMGPDTDLSAALGHGNRKPPSD